MLHLGTVNLYKLCEVYRGNALSSSFYRRLQRFILEVQIPQRELVVFLVNLIGVSAGSWKLAMDRTNWKIYQLCFEVV